MKDLKLGQKVLCNAKLVKVKPIPYVYQNEKDLEKAEKENNVASDYIILENEEDCVDIKTKEIVGTMPFIGIVVGKVKVSTSNHWELEDNEYYERKCCYKCEQVECYKVYYSLNHSRLVPVEFASEVE